MNKLDDGNVFIIFLIVAFSLLMIFLFKAASDMAADNHICKLYGGIYTKVYNGYECIKDGKVIDLRHLGK